MMIRAHHNLAGKCKDVGKGTGSLVMGGLQASTGSSTHGSIDDMQ
jgi:hypothetical protein